MCQAEDNDAQEKNGLKIVLGPLIRLCCKIVIPYLVSISERQATENIRKFQEYFTSPTFYARLVSSAEYNLKETRQRKNQKPAALPDKGQFNALLKYTDEQIANYTKNGLKSKKDFVQLRKVVCSNIL
jgi:hypothetical protein